MHQLGRAGPSRAPRVRLLIFEVTLAPEVTTWVQPRRRLHGVGHAGDWAVVGQGANLLPKCSRSPLVPSLMALNFWRAVSHAFSGFCRAVGHALSSQESPDARATARRPPSTHCPGRNQAKRRPDSGSAASKTLIPRCPAELVPSLARNQKNRNFGDFSDLTFGQHSHLRSWEDIIPPTLHVTQLHGSREVI